MRVTVFYLCMTLLAMACSGIYVWKWHKHFDIYYAVIYMLVPFLNAGYLLVSVAKDVGEALTATKITYLGGCYLLLLIMMSAFSLCRIRLPRWLSFTLIVCSTVVYASVLTAGHLDIFYRNAGIDTSDGFTTVVKAYGPMHSAFYALIILYLAITTAVTLYGLCRKKEAPVKSLLLLLFLDIMSVFVFFFGKKFSGRLELIPAAYLLDLISYLFIVDRLALYDIGAAVAESLVEHGEHGFVSVDWNLNFLGANATAKALLPALKNLRVDRGDR